MLIEKSLKPPGQSHGIIQIRVNPFETGGASCSLGRLRTEGPGHGGARAPYPLFGEAGQGIIDLEIGEGNWADLGTYEQAAWVLRRTAEALGLPSPVELGSLATSRLMYDLLGGRSSHYHSTIAGWLESPGSFLWGAYFTLDNSSTVVDIHIPGRGGWITDDRMAMTLYLILRSLPRIRLSGSPSWENADVAFRDFLASLCPRALDSLGREVYLDLANWRMKDSLEFLIGSTGKYYWENPGFAMDISPGKYPILGAIDLVTEPGTIGTTGLHIGTVELTPELTQSLIEVPSRLGGKDLPLCFPNGTSGALQGGQSILCNQGLPGALSIFFQTGRSLARVAVDDLRYLRLAHRILSGADSSLIGTALLSAMHLEMGRKRSSYYSYQGVDGHRLTVVLNLLFRREDVPLGVLDSLIRALTIVQPRVLDAYEEERGRVHVKDFLPCSSPLKVGEGALRELLRKPLRLCTLGHLFSDACIEVDTTPVLDEIPVLVKLRLSNPRHPKGLEYWISQTTRDHDGLLEAASEKKKKKEENPANA